MEEVTIEMHLDVNGEKRSFPVSPARSLLDILREELDLTGAKRGCDIGQCGSCTVIMNGNKVKSCAIKAKTIKEGTKIETIEGLAEDGKLHHLQEAFTKAQAFQCGYCTPGMIMAAKALLDKSPKPTEEQIKTALQGNLCRCTGYQQIIEAVRLASEQITEEELGKEVIKIVGCDGTRVNEEFSLIGKSTPRVESREKVTGKLKYTDDIKIEGALRGFTVRSPHPHARIKGIDTSKAEAYHGVERVLTWRDVTGENVFGLGYRDQPVLCKDKVRFVGDAVAFILAETEERAKEAAELVEVEYEPLKAVFDPEEAVKPHAPIVHESRAEGLSENELRVQRFEEHPNVLSHSHLEKGDIEKGFAGADLILEGRYTTQPQDHTPLETESCISYWDEEGRLTVTGSLQHVFFVQLNVARALGVPKEDIRVIQPPGIGSAFGKREHLYAQIHCALGTFTTGKPVKCTYTREETMQVTTKRTRQRTYIKTGVTKVGKITARKIQIYGDAGAYASWSRRIMRKASVMANGPYEVPNTVVDTYAIYTNCTPTGAIRGFGSAETTFCSETHMDEIAEKLGMDPLEFRLKNMLKDGSLTATNHRLPNHGVAIIETAREGAKEFRWKERKEGAAVSGNVRRGVGMAAFEYGVGFGDGIPDQGDVIVELHEDGNATLYVGSVDYGNGSNTTFAMLASELLGIPMEGVAVVNADTHRTKNCYSTVATRVTYIVGNAVVKVCNKVRRDMLAVASRLLDASEDELSLKEGYLYHNGKEALPISEVSSHFVEFGKPRRREDIFKGQKYTSMPDPLTGQGAAWWPLAWGAQFAQVEVNIETGEVKVPRMVAAHYVGRVLNPQAVRGQIVGGLSMGWGFGLGEDCKYNQGVPTATNFDNYKIMRAKEMPDVVSVIVEKPEATGPFGAIGIGEPPTVPTAAAINNAVADAIGVRINDLPLTPERVKEALTQR